MFFYSNVIWIPDEICTYVKVSTSYTINQIINSIYYITLGVPLIVGIINFFLVKRLNSLATTSSVGKFKKNENKTIFINLLIQTFQPFIGQWPSILFYFYLTLSGNNVYIVWRILDGLTAISLVSNILFSIVFIKDVRNAIFRKIGVNAINDVTNMVTITNDNTLKSKPRRNIIV